MYIFRTLYVYLYIQRSIQQIFSAIYREYLFDIPCIYILYTSADIDIFYVYAVIYKRYTLDVLFIYKFNDLYVQCISIQ